MAFVYILDYKRFKNFHATKQIIMISNPKINKILCPIFNETRN